LSGQDETETPETSANARVKELLFPSRPAPSRVTTQAAHVLKRKFNGDTAAMAAAYNVTPPCRPPVDRRHPQARQARRPPLP
jgi:hypothetical protein